MNEQSSVNSTAIQSLKSLLTRRIQTPSGQIMAAEQGAKAFASNAVRAFSVEKIANGLIVNSGSGVVRYCKDANEAAEIVAADIRRAFQ